MPLIHLSLLLIDFLFQKSFVNDNFASQQLRINWWRCWCFNFFKYGQIYPSELQLNKTNTSDTEAAFLDLHLSISNDIVFYQNL